MIILLAAIFFALFGFAIDAQTLPERYMVTDVAADDVLNIRSEPTSGSDVIGELGPYTLNVEVLRTQDGWGYIGAGEQSGWVSMRYLADNPPPPNEVPRPLACFGTEPFWSLTLHPRGAEYNDPNVGRRPLAILRESVAYNGYVIEAQEGPTLIRTVTINALPCNDGMSDRDFGMSMTMFTEAPDGNSVQTGCCTLQVN